jgi:hypothetical protein
MRRTTNRSIIGLHVNSIGLHWQPVLHSQSGLQPRLHWQPRLYLQPGMHWQVDELHSQPIDCRGKAGATAVGAAVDVVPGIAGMSRNRPG